MAFQSRGLTNQIRDYIIIERIGVGSYGMIYKVLTKNSKQMFVLKQIPFLSSESKQEIEEVKNEASILSQLNSRFIVKYYESFEENNNLNIVMEHCEGGDLCSYLSTMKKYTKVLNENQIWKFFIQLSLGLDYIHKRKILHRDLKTMNIFLTKDLDIKIGDLGVAKRLLNTTHAHTFIGTPFYLSPEICEEKPYNEKSDVWALGCILYEMTTFKHPFNATNQAALFIKILNGTYEPIVNKYSKELKKMISMLLEKDYIKRPSIRQIIETPIFLSKAKALGMLDIVIDTLSFFNQGNNNGNNKIKMIKISSIQKMKEKEKESIKNKVRKRKRENSLKGSSIVQSELESQSGSNRVNNSNINHTKDSNKAINKLVNGSDVLNKKQNPKAEKPKLFLPTTQNNNINGINGHNGNNNHHKSNALQLKKPIANIIHYDSGIMRKLSQISNDYNKVKEEEYNHMMLSSRKKEYSKQLNDKEKLHQQSNSNNKPRVTVLKEQDAEEDAKKSSNCFSVNNQERPKKKILHLNSIHSVGSSGLINQAKENQRNALNKIKTSKDVSSSDIYQFAKELDKKTLKLASIQTIKKSKTNDKIQHVPLFKNSDDQFNFKVEEAGMKEVQTIEDNSIENVEVNSTVECQDDNSFKADNGGSNDDEDELEDEDEDETVLIIKSSEYIQKQESEMIQERNERIQSLEQFKSKYSYYQNGILNYSGLIDCEYFFNLYKQLENNEDVDEKTNKIIDYIHKTIPDKEAEFTKLFHNYIVYEVKLRESEKELKAWKMKK